LFTGIIREIGVVRNIAATAEGRRIEIASSIVAAGLAAGDSVAVNGVCLTAVGFPSGGGGFAADVLGRTWELTTIGALKPGDTVNLEPSLRAGDSIGGHFVLGHVDGQGTLLSREERGPDTVLAVRPDRDLLEGLVLRGSLALDGVSLTIARLERDLFHVHLIPFTLRHTSLGRKPPGSRLNIELDVLGKHARRAGGAGLTEEFLRDKGF
jgi:riboflavin synthase